jgi:ABC-type dipeptide/oligopeptide/nickel transport system ATPase component
VLLNPQHEYTRKLLSVVPTNNVVEDDAGVAIGAGS